MRKNCTSEEESFPGGRIWPKRKNLEEESIMPMRKESILFNEYWTGAFARGDLGPQSPSKYFNVGSSKEAAYILKAHQVPFHSKLGPHFDKWRTSSYVHHMSGKQCSGEWPAPGLTRIRRENLTGKSARGAVSSRNIWFDPIIVVKQ